MLYAIEIPSHGGNTLYANGFKAYDALPDDMKQRLAGKRALNAYDYDNAPTLRADELPEGVKRFAHPIVRTHPATGRKSLYVNRLMTWSILDMPHAEIVSEVFRAPYRYERGHLQLDDAPGIGVELDEERAKALPYVAASLPVNRKLDGTLFHW